MRILAYRSLRVVLPIVMFVTAACSSSPNAVAPTATAQPAPATAAPVAAGAFNTGVYRNLFKERGRSDAEIQAKVDGAWQQFFYGDDETQRIYFLVGDDMAYIKDIGQGFVHSEGMSYGMMVAVQMDKQEEFDRLWKWARTYLYQAQGGRKGLFAWKAAEDGTVLDKNSAPDGEEYIATALFFASGRWGDGQGIFNYRAEAQALLATMLHKAEEQNAEGITNLFDPTYKYVVFGPYAGGSSFTNPSYHLPAFYELWARWADKDNQFWRDAAAASREFFRKAAHPQTGLMPDYAEFDGRPADPWNGDHEHFRFDAWRAAMNVAVDYAWFAADEWQVEQSNRLLDFFAGQGIGSYANQYTLDGKPLSGDHSPGLVAMNAVAGLAAADQKAAPFVDALWAMPLPSGKWRYYDGMLTMFGLLHASGNFRIYAPR